MLYMARRFFQMRGVVYSTRAADPAAGAAQGATILEIWFEDLQICINQNNEVFRHNGPRKALNHFGTLDFPAGFCDTVKKYVEMREKMEQSNSQVFTALRKKLMNHKGKHFKMEDGR